MYTPIFALLLQVCDKNQIRKENKTEYIVRERDILKHITDNWNTNVPYFVRLHATFQVRLFSILPYSQLKMWIAFIREFDFHHKPLKEC